ncbi:phenylalanine--tRNA ligase subunit beta [Nakamurella lactea]|uniref:phenylalanine--tRNA ligase subunit beta n=1 Tax=Nakamurella lactea TaxID=459515 RepID=UPI000405ADF2|nr:phenylalanine--tRNA ligase subunit beta [Nakamurella lactea]
MRAPLSWLREYAALPEGLTPEQISDMFVSIGFEIEDVYLPEPTIGPLVVGRVSAIEELTEFKKPIRFCVVEVGPGNGAADTADEAADGAAGAGPAIPADSRGIICGATNFVVGDLVVVALPGTELPGGFTIGSRMTYGRLSDGMICASDEVGVGTDHDGIIVLGHGELPGISVGDDARSLIGTDDPVFDVSVETDRGYALSIRGLARELAIGFGVDYTDPAGGELRAVDAESVDTAYPVRIDDPSGCSRFVAVGVTGADLWAPSPALIRRRLDAAGIRAISLAVDVTNYVMLELGQPLHAYDRAKLSGPIVVRRAEAGETLRTLDGVDRTLIGGELLITDDSGPIGLAGVMGGETTEISTASRDVVLEAAAFNPPDISRVARRQHLPSEASKRFERAVDPAIAAAAAERAAALIAEYGGGSVSAGRTDVGGVTPLPTVRMPLSEPERLAGRPYDAEVVVRRLEQVGATVRVEADEVLVTPPSWRPDLQRPADLVEEVARLESYDTIPSVLPVPPSGSGFTRRQQRLRSVAEDLAAAGLTETLSFPFVGAADLDALGIGADDVRRRLVRLANPLDAGRPFLRPSLLPGLLGVVVRNLSRGVRDLSLFEIGQVFLPRFGAPSLVDLPVDHRPTDAQLAVIDAALPDQPRRVAVVLAGDLERAGWWGAGRPGDWADAIEFGRRIAAVCGHPLRVVPVAFDPFHPGRCGELRIGDWPVGHAGELHPAVIERLGLPERTSALELNLDAIPEAAEPPAPTVSSFPPVHLDVALTVPDRVRAADLAEALAAGGGELLESVRLFDLYTGNQVAAGHRSLAFALTVRAADRTLTGSEATEVRDAAVAAAAERYGAQVRG